MSDTALYFVIMGFLIPLFAMQMWLTNEQHELDHALDELPEMLEFPSRTSKTAILEYELGIRDAAGELAQPEDPRG